MGLFTQRITIADLSGENSVEIDAVVDTGSFYSVIPKYMLHQLDVEPIDRISFRLVNDEPIEMDIGYAWITLDGRRRITTVAFGSDTGPFLLGAFTLEGLEMAVDPHGKRLVHIDYLPA
ncbi:MAG: Retroviral aspartyl protease [Chloroflexota bacterium]|nr:Retroviral aspartyl protease [Chloroflexota bacterium]MDE2894361.1 Retroviral aspartyl protease [Chloroflexota bacterium]